VSTPLTSSLQEVTERWVLNVVIDVVDSRSDALLFEVSCYVSVAEFYAPRYGTVDADPSLPEQKLSLNWVYLFKTRQNLATSKTSNDKHYDSVH